LPGKGKGNGTGEWHRTETPCHFPPDDGRMVDNREAWIQHHAEELRCVLRDPQARAEVLALLGGDDQEARRTRRLAELQAELDQHELTWQRRDQHAT
jgi:hypothetical protein